MRRFVVTSVLVAWLAYAMGYHDWTIALLMQYQGVITLGVLLIGVLIVAVWTAPRWRTPVDLAWQMALFPGMGISQTMFYDIDDDVCVIAPVEAVEVGL